VETTQILVEERSDVAVDVVQGRLVMPRLGSRLGRAGMVEQLLELTSDTPAEVDDAAFRLRGTLHGGSRATRRRSGSLLFCLLALRGTKEIRDAPHSATHARRAGRW
jgi:hypothetical protein